MGQVSVTLNDRVYRLVCGDGEEDRLVELAAYVKTKVEKLRAELGHVGDERLVLMAALTIADELFDARAGVGLTGGVDGDAGPARATAAPGKAVEAARQPPAVNDSSEIDAADHVQQLKAVAARMAAERQGAQKPAPITVASPKPKRRDVA
jgi:cell division protein ZapA